MTDDDVRAGKFVWGGTVHAYLSFRRSVTRVPPELTPAERALVTLVAQRRSNAEIAQVRGVSKSTVANQLYSIFRKLGVRSRQELLLRLHGG